MLLSLWHLKTVRFFLSIIFSVTVSPSKRFSSVWIAKSLFSILIHQNTKSAIVLCVYDILKECLKAPSKISQIDVYSAHHQEPKTIKFIHFLINCGETFQGRPNSVLKWRSGRPQDTNLKIYYKTLLYFFQSYFTKCVAWNTEKLVATYSYSFGKPPCGRSQNIPKRSP